MSTHIGSDIINNNLILHLDANNIKSYDTDENLFTYSQDFSNAAYSTVAHTFTSSGNPSSGPTAGYLLTNVATASNFANLSRDYITTSPSFYTFSVCVKAGSQAIVSPLIGVNGYNTAVAGGMYFRVKFNLNNLTFTEPQLAVAAGVTITIDKFSYNYETIGNGWYRVYIIADLTSAANITSINAGLYTGPYGDMIAQAGTNVNVAGYMLTTSSCITPYTLTTNAIVSRTTTVSDISNTKTTGTLQNNPSYNNGSLVFNGTNQSISLPSLTDLQFLGRSAYTLNIWTYILSVPETGYPGLIDRESNPGSGRDGYNLWVSKVGQTTGFTNISSERFGTGTNNPVAASVSDSSLINVWNNICIVFDGSTLYLYRNGVLLNSASSTVSITNTTKSMTIALRGTYLNCKIGNISIYNKALSSTDVIQNFNALRGRFGL